MKLVERYIAKDGKIFETESACEQYEARLNFEEKVVKDGNYCYGELTFMDTGELIDFVVRYREDIYSIIQDME